MKFSIRFVRFTLLLACFAASLSVVFADVKIKARQTMQGQSYENTVYIKGKRQRTERNMGAMTMIDVMQCDLKRNIQIAPQTRTYAVNLWETAPSVQPTTQTKSVQTESKKGGVVTMTYTTKDTGERKQRFGYPARRIVSTIVTESSPDACTPMKTKMETDGWYIDAAFALECETERYKNYLPSGSNKPACQDRYETKQIGAAKRGYPVWEKMTMFDESGKESYSMINEVIELSNATLDAALFDVPAGYAEVKDASALYASAAASALNNLINTAKSASSNNAVNNAAQSTPNVSTAVGAKKVGVTRIGLATVKTGAVGEGMNAALLAAAIGNTLGEYLKSPDVELVKIEAKLPSQIDAEAKTKECDFVVYTNVAHKKGGGGLGGFGGVIGRAAGNIVGSTVPYGGTGAVIAGRVATDAIYTAASMAENVKAKDELTLEIKLNQPGNGTSAFTKQFKAKAKSDGEDIISPLIEQAAQAILDAAAKK